MRLVDLVMLSVGDLCENPHNPRRPLAKSYLDGLRDSIAKFGFCGILAVAKNNNNTYTVLNGNTRLQELRAHSVDRVPCQVIEVCEEGKPSWEEERKLFVLSYDRNAKKFDDVQVMEQLAELVRKGADVKALAKLTARPNLSQILADKQEGAKVAQEKMPQAAMATMVLYGPKSAVDDIALLLKDLKGKLSTLEKAHKAGKQIMQLVEWSDPDLLALLLATGAAFGKTP